VLDFDKFIKRFRRKTFSRHHNFYLDLINGDFTGYPYGYNIYKGFKVTANKGTGLTSLIEKVIIQPVEKSIVIYASAFLTSCRDLHRYYAFQPVKSKCKVIQKKMSQNFSAKIGSQKLCSLRKNAIAIPFINSFASFKSCNIIKSSKTINNKGEIKCYRTIEIAPLN